MAGYLLSHKRGPLGPIFPAHTFYISVYVVPHSTYTLAPPSPPTPFAYKSGRNPVPRPPPPLRVFDPSRQNYPHLLYTVDWTIPLVEALFHPPGDAWGKTKLVGYSYCVTKRVHGSKASLLSIGVSFAPGRVCFCFPRRHGRCEKPGCVCVKARAARSGKLGFKMCECGHPFEAHHLMAGGTAASRGLQCERVLPEKKVR